MEYLWDFKKMYRLGDSYSEAMQEFIRMSEKMHPSDDLDPNTLCDVAMVSGAAKTFALAGVYFLVEEGEIVYVGRSDNVFSRLSDHMKNKDVTFDSVHSIAAEGLHQARLEQLYIGKFRPRYNIKHVLPLPV